MCFVFFLITANVLQLGEVAELDALTFNLALMFIRIPNAQFSTKTAILPNCCVCPASAGHTPKAFQIVQKYKFRLQKLTFGVLFFQRV
jgi:hypothetical protein